MSMVDEESAQAVLEDIQVRASLLNLSHHSSGGGKDATVTPDGSF